MRITDSRIRAAVWMGTSSGRWHVDVYYAVRRVAGSVVLRAQVDGADDAIVIERTFDSRLAALDHAALLVRTMRQSAAVAAGALTTDAALAAVGLDVLAGRKGTT